MNDGDIIERNGRKFLVTFEYDDDSTPPWEREDGHGPVSEWTTRDKHPGERVLVSDRPHKRYYDFAEAVKIARQDGWDAEPVGTGTAGETAARAAEADFKHLQDWCNDQWQYIGVVVRPVCPCCGQAAKGYSFALWGIESNSTDYLGEVASELIDEALAEVSKKSCVNA